MYSEKQRQQIFDDICELIISGKSLRFALNEVSLPAKTFFVWLRDNEVLSKQYARATTERAELMFEDMFDIADDGTNDWMEKKNDKGEGVGWSINGEHIQRSRVRIDTRKWALSKMMPKKYGAKAEQVEESENNTPTIKIEYVTNERTKPKNRRKVR